LITSEQGLGDEIMFASCLPDVIRQADRCTIECEARLVDLFRRSFPSAEVFPKDMTNTPSVQAATAEYQMPMGSLPGLYRTKREDFPEHRGYLIADPVRVAYWHDQLAGMDDRRKIGISWLGGSHQTRKLSRSVPLAQWSEILEKQDCTFISLQYTECQQELDEVYRKSGVRVLHWPEVIADLDELAAMICALDQIISVQTAVVHLAGALGCKVRVMIPVNPEWRYRAQGHDMPWYPSVHLYRQQQAGKWADVIHSITRDMSG
jgi:ADP-heptose:LPS heptosyltransferase